MQGSIRVWPTNKTKYEVAIAKAAGTPLAAPVVARANEIIQAIDKEFLDIPKKDTAIRQKKNAAALHVA